MDAYRKVLFFAIEQCNTRMRIADANIGTITEINSMHELGLLSDKEYVEVWEAIYGERIAGV